MANVDSNLFHSVAKGSLLSVQVPSPPCCAPVSMGARLVRWYSHGLCVAIFAPLHVYQYISPILAPFGPK